MSQKHIHHIVPKHMGGTDDPENLIELSVEDHAEAHRILYEKYGRWEDQIAWLGLSGQIGKEEVIRRMLSEAGKKGGAASNHVGHSIPHTESAKQKISENSKQSKPIHTPQGEFPSLAAYAHFRGVSEVNVRNLYSRLDKEIDRRGKHTIVGKESIGKTPRELGYYYV